MNAADWHAGQAAMPDSINLVDLVVSFNRQTKGKRAREGRWQIITYYFPIDYFPLHAGLPYAVAKRLSIREKSKGTRVFCIDTAAARKPPPVQRGFDRY